MTVDELVERYSEELISRIDTEEAAEVYRGLPGMEIKDR